MNVAEEGSVNRKQARVGCDGLVPGGQCCRNEWPNWDAPGLAGTIPCLPLLHAAPRYLALMRAGR